MNILGEREMDMLPPVIDYNKKFNYYRNLSIKEHIRGPSNYQLLNYKNINKIEDISKLLKNTHTYIYFLKVMIIKLYRPRLRRNLMM